MNSFIQQKKNEAADKREFSIGKYATFEQQQFFNELSKILNHCYWDDEKIITGDAIISPPYDVNSINFKPSASNEIQDRLKKFVVDKWSKVRTSQK